MTTATITRFDYSTARVFRERLSAAVKAIGAEFGLDISLGNARFETGEFSAGMTATAKSAKAADFARMAAHYGFVPTDLGRRTLFRGRYYEITGFNPGAPKYAVSVKRLPDGKVFRMPVELVKRGLV